MAEQPAADPVLAEATGLAGTAMFMTSGAPGMVLVVVRGDRSLVLGYGETEKTRPGRWRASASAG